MATRGRTVERGPHAPSRNRFRGGRMGWPRADGCRWGYLGDPEKTARTFPTVDGQRYSVPGDRARFNDDGTIHLLGRESMTINSGGEKIFAEEVEIALKRPPGGLRRHRLRPTERTLGTGGRRRREAPRRGHGERRRAPRHLRRARGALQAAEGLRAERRGPTQPEWKARLRLGARAGGSRISPDPRSSTPEATVATSGGCMRAARCNEYGAPREPGPRRPPDPPNPARARCAST